MKRGADTVTFLKENPSGSFDRQGNPIMQEDEFDMPNCWVQPMSVHDKVGETTYSDATHRIISPPAGAALACQAEDFILWDNARMRVVGVKVHRNRGMVDHVTVIAKEEHG